MGLHRSPVLLGGGNAGADGSPSSWEEGREAKAVKGRIGRSGREVLIKGLVRVVEKSKGSKGRAVTMALGNTIPISYYVFYLSGSLGGLEGM